MNNIHFDIDKEFLLTSGTGAFSASTIQLCNTRKYHGLFIVPVSHNDDEHMILSCMDEKVIYDHTEYLLGTHQYPGAVFPKGYEYISQFENWPAPTWTYKLGEIVLIKEILMPEGESALMIRYTVKGAKSPVALKLYPFTAFRNIHDLCKANPNVNYRINQVDNGIKLKLYEGFEALYLQYTDNAEFVHAPDWYYNLQYEMEKQRGYDFHEDLYVPGYFEVMLNNNDQFIVYAGLNTCDTSLLKLQFDTIYNNTSADCTLSEQLTKAAKQFIEVRGGKTRVKAGFYWFGPWGRDTFISLPGLTLFTGDEKIFCDVIKTSLTELKDGLFPNVGTGEHAAYNSADAPLWFIWAMQQYYRVKNEPPSFWKEYGDIFKTILSAYKNGTSYSITMDEDGLINSGDGKNAVTWMDAVVDNIPVTPRTGKAVEINALWYNAVCFCLDLAGSANDISFVNEWAHLPGLVQQSFIEKFYHEDQPCLADVGGKDTDWSVRPNQVFAISLPFPVLPEFYWKKVMTTVKDELLNPKGLRTLSANDPKYKGSCEGDQRTRDAAYHQGTIWPWLTCHFAEAWYKAFGEEEIDFLNEVYIESMQLMGEQCLGSVPEILNGDFPYHAVGAVAQAWSVAEMLRMRHLLIHDFSGHTKSTITA